MCDAWAFFEGVAWTFPFGIIKPCNIINQPCNHAIWMIKSDARLLMSNSVVMENLSSFLYCSLNSHSCYQGLLMNGDFKKAIGAHLPLVIATLLLKCIRAVQFSTLLKACL